MKTPLKPSSYLASLTALMVVLGGALLLPSFPAPLAAGATQKSAAGCHEAGKGPSRCHDLVEMEVRDVIPLKEASTHAVVLVSKDRTIVLPIFVDESAAVSIAFRLAHRQAPHPLSHDLMDDVISQMGGKVTEVRIDDVENQIYTGRVFITQGRKHLEVAARPSDSISMALNKGAKIYASQKVLTAAGITREEIERLREKGGVPGAPEDEEEAPGVGGSGPPPGVMPPGSKKSGP
ncbi:MAG TPA: bifunctional nuclease family protein, partial [Myxococcaceae bacterium]|nr:bifunctional nuclease family protein [Myxococcaceae bacterium]